MNEQPSPPKPESREQTMLREEQEMKELMVEQYYRYVSLLKATKNFQRCIDTYERVNLYQYSGHIAVIGRITEVAMVRENGEEFCYPLVATTVNKILFQDKDRLLSKRTFTPIIRKFMISGSKYRSKLLLPLNKVVSTSKKNKEQLFIFTHLRLLLKDEKQLCFGLSDDSFIIQLDPIYYAAVFKNIELSLTSTFSDLHLQAIYPQMDLNKGSTFVVQDVRTRIHEKLEGFVVMGILKKVIWSSMKKAVNAKEKEVALDIIQDSFHRGFKSIGICRIYVRFDILDEQDLLRHLKEGCIYIFMVNQVLLGDNVVLNLKINQWRKNFLRITSSPVRSRSINDLYRQMQPSQMSDLMDHCIFRNLYKFSVIKYDIKLLHTKVTCQKCQGPVFRSESYEYNCKNDCGKIKGKLRLWAIVGVMDASCYAEMTMQDKCAFDFFDVPEDQLPRFKEQVAKEEQDAGKSGIMLYFKTTKDQFNDDQPKTFITAEQNEFLACFVEQWVIKIIEKNVVGSAKINTNENFKTFDDEVKQEALTSFAKPKEYFKKAKVFVNGHLRTFQGRGRLIPFIKIESVVN